MKACEIKRVRVDLYWSPCITNVSFLLRTILQRGFNCKADLNTASMVLSYLDLEMVAYKA